MARETIEVRNEDGEIKTWGAVEDVWDFDLQSWIQKRQLQWIMPGDEELVLKDFGKCPYAGLPGTRDPQVIELGKLKLLSPPDGEPIDPFG